VPHNYRHISNEPPLITIYGEKQRIVTNLSPSGEEGAASFTSASRAGEGTCFFDAGSLGWVASRFAGRSSSLLLLRSRRLDRRRGERERLDSGVKVKSNSKSHKHIKISQIITVKARMDRYRRTMMKLMKKNLFLTNTP
jgi:hypothetical protein